MKILTSPNRAIFRRFLLIIAILLLAGLACKAVSLTTSTPVATLTPAVAASQTAVPTTEPAEQTNTPAVAQPPATVPPTTALEPFTCGAQPAVAALLDQTTPETWMDWIEKLSGAEPVTIGGKETVIKTRFTLSMFGGDPDARAFDYVRETVRGWYAEDQVQVMDFHKDFEHNGEKYSYDGKNLVLTIPGAVHPEEIVVMSAHLDSMSPDPTVRAPGAEDNGSGSAALLEAARLFRGRHFDRTIQIVWFTGEELGLHGSQAFVEQISDPGKVVGDVNLDMFGYDSDSDRCFEMHVGTLPASDRVGQCFVDTISAYNLDLPRYDYKTTNATDRSDHGSFWQRDIGAVEILENMFDDKLTDQGQPQACPNGDMDPNYHTEKDTVDQINQASGIQIVRAAIATVASMAGLQP